VCQFIEDVISFAKVDAFLLTQVVAITITSFFLINVSVNLI